MHDFDSMTFRCVVGMFLLVSAPNACAVAQAGASARAEPPAKVATGAANVVVVVIDTLRADRLSCYGHSRPTTPSIDALAKRGLRFERAYATAPWTLPSTASLMSGLAPDLHRATGFLSVISPDARLLAQALSEEGYESAAFIGNYFVQSLFGFERGFQSYDGSCMVDRAGINSREISDRAIEWLARPHEKPFLLYLHYFDPHYNYWEHEGFAYGVPDTDRVFSGEDIFELREHLNAFDAEDRKRLDALYDSEVAFTDHHVGRVFARLDELELAENTLVVVTADHGEALGEHGWIGHTIQLYEESVRIPLVIAGPGVEPGVRGGDPVQLDDVFAPLLALARGESDVTFTGRAATLPRGLGQNEALIAVETTGMDEPDEVRPKKMVEHAGWRLFVDRDAEGTESYRLFKTDAPKGQRRKRIEDHPAELKQLLDLRAADLEERRLEAASNRSVLTRRRALVQGAWKLIVDEIAGRAELYDLASDPLEKHDLAANPAHAERRDALKRRLDELVAVLQAAALPTGEDVAPDVAEEARRKIEAIGYGSAKR